MLVLVVGVLLAGVLLAGGLGAPTRPAAATAVPVTTSPVTTTPVTTTPVTTAPVPPPAPALSALDWTDALCAGLQPVVDTLANPPKPDLRDLAATRQAYLSHLTAAARLAEQGRQQLELAGAPAVPDGDQVAARVRGELAPMRSHIERARARLERTGPADAALLGAAVGSAADVLGSLGNSAHALATISSHPQLGPAFRLAPACASLRSVG
jgi:hypothetical protein